MICVDASLAAKWLFPEPYSDEARAIFVATVSASERIVAPSFLPIEVTNVIRQRMRRARQPKEQSLSLLRARQLLHSFLEGVDKVTVWPFQASKRVTGRVH